MKSKYLLPHIYKKIGWFITIPFLVIGLFFFPLADKLDISKSSVVGQEIERWFDKYPGQFTDEIIAACLIIGMLLVAFSREKNEDEYINKIRLESLQISVLINYILLFFCIIFIYDWEFLWVMTYNMFTVLLIFIIRFNYIIYRNK